MISLLLTLELSPDEPHGPRRRDRRFRSNLIRRLINSPQTNLIPVHKLIRVSSKPRFLFGIDTHFYKLFAKNLFGLRLSRQVDGSKSTEQEPSRSDRPSLISNAKDLGRRKGFVRRSVAKLRSAEAPQFEKERKKEGRERATQPFSFSISYTATPQPTKQRFRRCPTHQSHGRRSIRRDHMQGVVLHRRRVRRP